MTGLAKIRTLVVEDNPTDALLLKEALAEIPGAVFETTWVERLADALPRLEQTRFDLVFLDLNLPDSDPPNTLARLGCFLPEAPVIVLTGLEIDAMGLKAIEMGAQDYLVKGPFPPGVLGRSIRFALGRHRGAQTLRANEVRQHNARKMGKHWPAGGWHSAQVQQHPNYRQRQSGSGHG